MTFLRRLFFPFVPVYYLVTWFINKAYDLGWFSSKSYNFPLICVGNLSVGGTGKSPMVDFLISLLKDDYNVSTLSRGYGRKTKGFILANADTDYTTIGDEPYQYYHRHGKSIKVAVCESRQNGIAELKQMQSSPDVILLDDAYQHRKVTAGFNILLSTYDNLFVNDMVLPTGDLREPKSGYKRANNIVVTKCPENLSEAEKKAIVSSIKPLKNQEVFFSHIAYSEQVIGKEKMVAVKTLSEVTLVTGIANPKPLLAHLDSENVSYTHHNYPDHHNFTAEDIAKLSTLDFIVTTEKDYMRLMTFSELSNKLYYLPIEVVIDRPEAFKASVRNYIKAYY